MLAGSESGKRSGHNDQAKNHCDAQQFQQMRRFLEVWAQLNASATKTHREGHQPQNCSSPKPTLQLVLHLLTLRGLKQPGQQTQGLAKRSVFFLGGHLVCCGRGPVLGVLVRCSRLVGCVLGASVCVSSLLGA